jgi:hypothetical protein
MSTVIPTHIQLWRQQCLDGTITQETMRQAIAAIRKERTAASSISAASTAKKATAKAKAAPIDSDALLDGLGEL